MYHRNVAIKILNFAQCMSEYRVSVNTNRLLLAVLGEYEDSGTTEMKDVKETPAEMLPPTLINR